MSLSPDPADRDVPTKWKRQPVALWVFMAIGAVRIILSGIDVVVFRRRR